MFTNGSGLTTLIESLGSIKIYRISGFTWRKCRACGKSIKGGTMAVLIHRIGELPATLHSNCTLELSDKLKKVVHNIKKYDEGDWNGTVGEKYLIDPKHRKKCGGRVSLLHMGPDQKRKDMIQKVYVCNKCTFEKIVYKKKKGK